ncbi:MAG: phosphate ABC transporter permease PstA [Fimbriimonadaceae bacterium]|nr:phosphate ABC transporter permease PstA [Fimbriimonadaceae bacterium]
MSAGFVQDGSTSRLASRRQRDRLFAGICRVATLLAVAVLGFLLFRIVAGGIAGINWNFLTGMPTSDAKTAGILPALIGSAYIVLLSAVLTVPIGVMAAVYLEEFANRNSRWANLIEVNINNLSGVPSIVYGMLGLGIFISLLGMEKGVLVGAMTMGILVLPMVILVTRESLRAVPKSLREGALALGATPGQTVWRMVIPNALPGILTGIILAVSRALGETAPLIVVGAVSYVTFLPESLNDSYSALPLQIYSWSRMPANQGFDVPAAGAILVLILLLLCLNSVALILRRRADLKKRA